MKYTSEKMRFKLKETTAFVYFHSLSYSYERPRVHRLETHAEVIWFTSAHSERARNWTSEALDLSHTRMGCA